MKIAASATTRGPVEQLLPQCLDEILKRLGNQPIHLVVVFTSNHFEEQMEDIGQWIRAKTDCETLIGCAGETVVGPQHEHESEPTIAVWAAHMPDVSISPFHINSDVFGDDYEEPDWAEIIGVPKDTDGSFLFLGDPFSLNPRVFLDGMNKTYAGRHIIGGMASGVEQAGQTALLLNDEVFNEGGVGTFLSGNIETLPIVSQGCRPVGRPYVITKADQHIVYELGGKKPLPILNQIYQEASTSEQKLMRQGILFGIVMNEMQPEFHQGDFLIRNLMGAEPDSGAIAVGDHVRVGVTVQFQIRDAESAHEDLLLMLNKSKEFAPAGGLLFSCNGRGTRMFSDKDHDVSLIQQAFENIPIAGFFCAGEIGPVGGKNFIHGHTASMALFRKRA